ncbi:response regulator [Thiocapsa bogorovii]|uniref:response regulator n=1 Tax=Thiocapsa bogorovii TaxID=521689 RepID=UPI001E5B55AD|nr:response regulator [Thiocapsa bogorovii]UHD15152.1 response regulator [Thiocapsa bogorovii]
MAHRILIIDDEESIRDAFSLALGEEQGYEIFAAASGAEGLALVRERRPDLIFLDLHMPGMSGVDVMRSVLADDPSALIYIVTAFHQEFMQELRAVRDEGLTFELARKPLGAEQIRIIARGILGGGVVDPTGKAAP